MPSRPAPGSLQYPPSTQCLVAAASCIAEVPREHTASFRYGMPSARFRRHARQGFTLIEVLVVLTIVGLVASGISLSLETLRGRDTDRAIERLRHVLEHTAERAQTRGQPIALELLTDGYRFSTLDTDGRWVAFEEAPLFVERVLPNDLSWGGLRLDTGETRRLVFGNRAPRFELAVDTPAGRVLLSGTPTGAVSIDGKGR